tara:strand:- start:1624 stop:2481 length:858 start_codon:yes stop_codon:yes gene_type:complete
MASLNEIAYNVRNIARGGYASDDELISIRQIKHWVHYHRAQLLMNYTSNGNFIHPQTFQLYTSQLTKNTTPEPLYIGVAINAPIPPVIQFNNERAVDRVELIAKAGSARIACQATTQDKLEYDQWNRFTPGAAVSGNLQRYFLTHANNSHGRYTYGGSGGGLSGGLGTAAAGENPGGHTSPVSTTLTAATGGGIIMFPDATAAYDASTYSHCRVYAVFSDPRDVPEYTDGQPYPMPPELIQPLIESILTKELNVTLQAPNDEMNDSSGVIKTRATQAAKTKRAKA